MSALDWCVMALYLLGMLLLAAYIGRQQRSASDYFLAGRTMSSGALAASTLATQCSTNSLLGAPAFVGFTLGGGLIWLQYELAVPLAMAALIWLIVPARQAGVTSIYAILEMRLGVASRKVASASFLLFRGVATGVTIYGVSLVLALLLDISYLAAVALLMTVTIAYDLLGGLRAVVISDVIQLLLLTATVAISLVLLASDGGWQTLLSSRTDTLVNDWGMSGNDYGFWPMLIGGLFLYAAYYGCDQSQTQRVLAARSDAAAQRVLLLNGLLRFPLVLGYCLLGIGLAAFATAHPEFLTELPRTAAGAPNFNLVFPAYVLDQFAPGFVGLVMVGLLAAAMSSIDSAINSLSAATLEDFVQPRAQLQGRRALLASRGITLLWGVFCVGLSFQVETIAPTVLEAVNKIGSMANGPLLALFVIALLIDGVGQRNALIGCAIGLGSNCALAFGAPDVSWLWWNVSGFGCSLLSALLLSARPGNPKPLRLVRYRYPPRTATVCALAAMATAILAICLLLDGYQP
ncbi:MAG: hypothetical protein AB8B93_20400 [Pseudomonadales bacterium]